MSKKGQKNINIWLNVVLPIVLCFLVFWSVFSTTMLFIVVNNDDVLTGVREVLCSKKAANQNIGNILSGTVEITIPKEFITFFGEDYDYTLTEEQKDNGFTKVKKADDGSAVFTIDKEKYDVFLKELKATTAESLNETIETILEQGNSSIVGIEYSKKFEHITVYANKSQFNEFIDNLYVSGFGLTSCMYQMFDIDAKGKCTIDIIDKTTDEVFKTVIYPDEFNN